MKASYFLASFTSSFSRSLITCCPSTQYEQVRDEVLQRLAQLGLTGLQESVEANKEADGDSMMHLEQQ